MVAGTGTEVGKTWWACRLASHLRAANVAVAARKPAQSFASGDDPASRDAALLAAATGQHPDEVCPPHRSYAVAMAPPMAAAALGHPPFAIADLVDELRWPLGTAVGLVETAGGVRSPLAADGDNVSLIDALAPALVLLVAHAGLGTINLVRLSAGVLTGHRVVVALNRFDPSDDLHRRNRAWLIDNEGLAVGVTIDEVTKLLPSRPIHGLERPIEVQPLGRPRTL